MTANTNDGLTISPVEAATTDSADAQRSPQQRDRRITTANACPPASCLDFVADLFVGEIVVVDGIAAQERDIDALRCVEE